jgi:hypothetical protein
LHEAPGVIIPPVYRWRSRVLTSADIRQALERVAASEPFRDAENLRHLIVYLGEATLAGRADQLKEYTIGLEVLKRPAHYDPRLDSSARMLAARLRRKLEDYYRGDGAADTIRIGFPKGGYKLTFEEAAPQAPAGTSATEVRRWRLIAGLCAAAFLMTAAYALLLAFRSELSMGAALDFTPEVEALWRPVLDGKTPVLVSFGSPMFLRAPDGWIFRRHDLNDWSQVGIHPPLRDLQSALRADDVRPVYEYAGTGDVHGAFLIGRLLGPRASQLILKRGNLLSWEDIQSSNLVFIGNGKNQEKLRFLLEHLEFSVDGEGVHCRNPKPGEPAHYLNGRGMAAYEYGLLSFVPGSRTGRYVMILSANNTGGIWGMAEVVTNPRYAQPLVARLRRGGAMPKAYQAVVRIGLNGGVPVALDYVVHHELPSNGTSLQ